MIIRDREYMSEPPQGALLYSVIGQHAYERERLERLKRAYENKRDILTRSRSTGLPNNRLAHGYARYIVTMAAGYLIGKPVEYGAPEGMEKALEALNDAYTHADIQSIDAENATNAAIFGKGVELFYADEQSAPKSVALTPLSAFVVYESSAEQKPLFGVYTVKKLKLDGDENGYTVHVYTGSNEYVYELKQFADIKSAVPNEIIPHYFGSVPMLEYWNNESESGDFEQVQTLIDAYDVLQSDRINDKEQFVDALLVLYGGMMENDANGRTPAQQLREDKLLTLPDKDCGAEYLTKSLGENDVEVLKNAIKDDIHKFSMIPDMSDEKFAGNTSGVAMRYKLLGMEQLMRIKERWFKEALRERVRCFAHFLAVKGKPALDADAVTMTFTRSLPQNELEQAQTVQAYAGMGIVPDEALMTQVPFISDVADALEKLKQQKDEAANRQQAAFSGYNTES